MPHDHAHADEKTDARSWLTIGLILAVFLAGAFLLRPKLKTQQAGGPLPEKAHVVEILAREDRSDNGVARPYQKVSARLDTGASAGQDVEIELGATDTIGPQSLLKTGDRIYVGDNPSPDGSHDYYVYARDRGRTVIWLLAIFALTVLAVSRKRGMRALVALAFVFFMVTGFMMPQLAAGRSLVLIAVIGSVMVLGPTYLVSYGPTRKSALAALTSAIAMFVALGLSGAFASAMHLTGLADDDALNFATSYAKDGFFLYQLLIVGTLIGILGVLDDVIIAQISTVFELGEANAGLGRLELFRRAMRVGNDHIASVVNTLTLAYAGAALPLFLFYTMSPVPLGLIVSEESVATELVRMLAGTVSLVLAVPLATAIAAFFKNSRPTAN